MKSISEVRNSGAAAIIAITFLAFNIFGQLPFALFTLSAYRTLLMLASGLAIIAIARQSWWGYGITLVIGCELMRHLIGYYFGCIFYPILSVFYAASSTQSLLIGIFSFTYIFVLEVIVIGIFLLHCTSIVLSAKVTWLKLKESWNLASMTRGNYVVTNLLLPLLVIFAALVSVSAMAIDLDLPYDKGTISRYAEYDKSIRSIFN